MAAGEEVEEEEEGNDHVSSVAKRMDEGNYLNKMMSVIKMLLFILNPPLSLSPGLLPRSPYMTLLSFREIRVPHESQQIKDLLSEDAEKTEEVQNYASQKVRQGKSISYE